MSEEVVPSLVIEPPEPSKSRQWLLVGGVCALVLVVVLGIGGVFAYHQLTLRGASSPTSAVTQMLDGIADQNLRNIGRYVSPVEIDEVKPLLDAGQDEKSQQPDIAAMQDDAEALMGAFSLAFTDVQTSEQSIGDGLAKVTLDSANIAIDLDADTLKTRATALRDDYLSYLRANGQADEATQDARQLSDAKIDKLIAQLQKSAGGFPYHTTLDDLRQKTGGDDAIYAVTTEEDGRWYVSPSMTTGEYAFEEQQKADPSLTRGAMPTGDGASYATPEAATTGLIEAGIAFSKDGDLRTLADSLPTAERRFVDVYAGPLGDYDADSVKNSGTVLTLDKDDVSLAADKGDWARVRLDDVQVTGVEDGETSTIRVYNGTCFAEKDSGSTSDECLKDVLNDGIDSFATYLSGPMSTLPKALRDVVDAFPFDQVGVVAVKQDGSWHAGALPTVSDWYGLLLPSLSKLSNELSSFAGDDA